MSPRSASQSPGFIFISGPLFQCLIGIIVMVRTRGGSRLRPRVRFSTPEREEQAPVPTPVPTPVPSPVPEAVPEEPQGFRRYQTRMGPRAPSPVPERRSRRARPSKWARTSAQASHPPPGISHLQSLQLQRRHRHLSCRLLLGSGGRCSSGTPSRGMYGSTVESSIRSRTTMSLH